ncbi:2-oxoacid:acceptor oxidoreductase family protein, partial [Candidatus Bathyarchaeota archaeon]|nr:2-oxoacid:acceptor oxidoreductase family protein [Candidatus Bathyarchaeota archaeon]
QEALDKLLKDLKENGILIIDSTNVTTTAETSAEVHKIPMTETAKKQFGEAIYANMIMLGSFTKITGLVTVHSMEKTIEENVSPRTLETNIAAFRKGLQLETTLKD